MGDEEAVSEIIGALLLMGIIVASFAIFGALYLPTVIPPEIPKVQLSMACSDSIDDNTIEYPCIFGMYHCSVFDNLTCEDDCRYRAYSQNPQFHPDHLNREIYRCMENCLKPFCSDLENCRYLYICHNGGDNLQIDSLKIMINGNEIEHNRWEMKTPPGTDFISSSIQFGIGSTIRIRNTLNPIDTVTIIYSPPAGGELILLVNQFGTTING